MLGDNSLSGNTCKISINGNNTSFKSVEYGNDGPLDS